MTYRSWTWLSLSLLLMCGSLLVLSLAYWLTGLPTWVRHLTRLIALVGIFAPPAYRLLSRSAPRHERIALVVMLGSALFLAKVLYSPMQFKFVDELSHQALTEDVVESGSLFGPGNALIPVGAEYPGLHIVTAALATVSGWPVSEAGMLVTGAARLLFMLALFIFFERVISTSAAGIAVMIYAINPHFLFFGSYFVYQTLALAMAAYALANAAAWTKESPDRHLHSTLAILAISAVVIIHHVTSYLLGLLLLLWVVVSWFTHRTQQQRIEHTAPYHLLGAIALFLAVWIGVVARGTVSYLWPYVDDVATGVITTLAGGRSPDRSPPAPTGPFWEIAINATTTLAIGGLIVWALVINRREIRRSALMTTLTIVSLGYFAAIGVRVLSTDGAELAGRSWTFVYVAVAPVLCVLFAVLVVTRGRTTTALLATALFIGGTFGGMPAYWNRLPGPYLPSAFERSVTPVGVDAATWSYSAFGRGHQVVADSANLQLLATYGRQEPVYGLSWVYFQQGVGLLETNALSAADVDFLIVDYRLSHDLPARGFYFEEGEPDAFAHDAPLPERLLVKFSRTTVLDRIYDAGDIVIFGIKNQQAQRE